jgi:hydrogenase nickel incorporation protein HypB
MCEICGCDGATHAMAVNLQTGAKITLGDAAGPDPRRAPHQHEHADGTRHVHAHDRPHHHRHHDEGRQGGTSITIDIESRILAKNDALAARTRDWLAQRQILAVNLMGAPGAGKTALLERTIRDTGAGVRLFVLEGDQATLNDGERIRAAGAAAVQVNTGAGCHLDADMVARGLAELKPCNGGIVIVENVGNLVCPALFDLGERRRVVVLSVTEGDDKPLKYPHMFRAADLVLLNKIDLLPYVDFDVGSAVTNARSLNPDVTILHVSARTGQGMGEWYNWLRGEHPHRGAAEVARG